MCLAIPARVVVIEGKTARVEIMGNTRTADLTLLEDIAVDDYVLIHAGFAIQKLAVSEAKETLKIFESMERLLSG